MNESSEACVKWAAPALRRWSLITTSVHPLLFRGPGGGPPAVFVRPSNEPYREGKQKQVRDGKVKLPDSITPSENCETHSSEEAGLGGRVGTSCLLCNASTLGVYP